MKERLVAAWVVLLSSATARAELSVPPATAGITIDERPGAVLPLQAAFRDEGGRAVTLGHYFDGRRPVLLSFAYMRCPMLCSLVLEGEADALAASRLRPGTDFRLVTISIDPRDAPGDVAKRAEALRGRVSPALSREAWVFLAGDEAASKQVAQAAGFGYRRDPDTGEYAHAAALVAVAADGRVARYLYGVRFPPREVDRAVGAAARGDAGRSLEQVVLHCFRYVPSLRRHAGAVVAYLRGGGALIAVGAAALCWWAGRRRRAVT